MRQGTKHVLLALCALGIFTMKTPLAGADGAVKSFNIPAEDLGVALREFGRESNQQILFSTEVVRGKTTSGVKGSLTPEAALAKLLSGSGLSSSRTADGSFLVSRNNAKKKRALPETSGRVDQRATQRTDGSPVALQEVIVTAEKRQERLRDVPIPVTALSASRLVDSNQFRLQDYSSQVPSLSVAPSAVQGIQVVSIRGITTGGASNPTVGIVVDDVPYGASTAIAGGLTIPDLDPSDLARVEVLRGPQGTLYGASSMGGLIKYVTLDPSTSAFSGRIQAGLSDVHNGAEAGYTVRGSVNAPLNNESAIRASAFTRQDPGYIDNPVLGIRGLNEDHVTGGRLSGLWRPSDSLSLRLSALYQVAKGDGNSDVNAPTAGYPQTLGLGDLQQNYIRGIGSYDRSVQAYSASLHADLGALDLTVLSGYNVNRFTDSWDYSFALGAATEFGGAPVFDNSTTRKFSQEIRLTNGASGRIGWLLGGFYTHERTDFTNDVASAVPQTGQIVQNGILFLSIPDTYTEYAAFGDLTFRLTDRIDVQIGARESFIDQTSSQTESGSLIGPAAIVFPESAARTNAFTYLLTPRLKISSEVMMYARLASGYRAGGPNVEPGGIVPKQYRPDRTLNYELGLKGDFADGRLSADASVFYIDWRDIQIQLLNSATGLDYNTNGSRAKSDGLELSVGAHPVVGLNVSAWLVWNDAVLTQAFPPNTVAYGVSGDKLPYSAKFTGNASIEEDFPISETVEGVVGGSISYVGDRKDVFTSPPPAVPPRQELPAYTKVDFKAGLQFTAWTLNFFVNNAFDRRGLVTGGLGNTPPFSFVYIQPRTAGLSVSRVF